MKTRFKILGTLASIAAFLVLAATANATSYPLGGQTYYLAGAGVTSTQTTVQLTSFDTPDGEPIIMSQIGTVGYGALGVGTSKLEDIEFTGVTQNTNGTATLTGVTRGLTFAYPYAQNSSNELSHAGGSTFTITNTPQFYYNEFAMQNNNNVFTWPTASSSVATKGYADYVGSGGANIIPATLIAQGVVQLATGVQIASSTAVGSTGFNLVIPAAQATSTGGTASAALHAIVANNSGFLDPSFLPSNLSLSSSTIIGSTQALAIGKNEFATSSSGTWTVPSGITKVWVRMVGGGGASGNSSSNGCNGGGGSGGYAEFMLSVSSTLALTIGQGGATTTGLGGTGGSTIVGGVTALGGAGGNNDVTPNTQIGGGNGGLVTGATMGTMATSTGISGGNCTYVTTSGVPSFYGSLGFSVLGSPGAGGGPGGANGLTNGNAGNPGEVILTY